MVNGHLVSLSAAFFKVWLITYHTLLFIRLSFVCLASSSQSLNRYAIFLNKQLSLAGFVALTSLRASFKHFSQRTGVDFRFYDKLHLIQINWAVNPAITY